MDQSSPQKNDSPVLLASRRPIFDRLQRVWAYELSLNSPGGEPLSWMESLSPQGPAIDPDSGVDLLLALTGSKRALVRMSLGDILLGAPGLLPQDWLIWPQADPATPGPRFREALKATLELGWEIVLDNDFIRTDPDLATLARVLAVDCRGPLGTDEAQEMNRLEIPRLALNVETPEEYRLAMDQGFKYFQGRFYAKPEPRDKDKPLPGFRLNQLRLLKEIHGKVLRFSRIEEIITNDVTLAYDLLRYINTPFFALRVKVGSIRQALTLLGEEEIRKWISVVIMNKVAQGKPHELVVLSLVRALFFSEAGRLSGFEDRSEDLFLAGLFSLLDAFFDQPLAMVLKKIPLNQDIVAALLGTRTPLSGVVDLALAYEKNDWTAVNQAAIELDLDQKQLLKGYHRAVTGARHFFKQEEDEE